MNILSVGRDAGFFVERRSIYYCSLPDHRLSLALGFSIFSDRKLRQCIMALRLQSATHSFLFINTFKGRFLEFLLILIYLLEPG